MIVKKVCQYIFFLWTKISTVILIHFVFSTCRELCIPIPVLHIFYDISIRVTSLFIQENPLKSLSIPFLSSIGHDRCLIHTFWDEIEWVAIDLARFANNPGYVRDRYVHMNKTVAESLCPKHSFIQQCITFSPSIYPQKLNERKNPFEGIRYCMFERKTLVHGQCFILDYITTVFEMLHMDKPSKI